MASDEAIINDGHGWAATDTGRRHQWFVDFDDGAASDEDDGGWSKLWPATEELPANVVSSKCGPFHYPALDIDVPMAIYLSSTEGHYHVYFPTLKMTQDEYQRLLDALCDAGIVQRPWVNRLERDGQTVLRIPGEKKGF